MEGVGVAKIAQIMDLCNFLPDMELKGHRIMIRCKQTGVTAQWLF